MCLEDAYTYQLSNMRPQLRRSMLVGNWNLGKHNKRQITSIVGWIIDLKSSYKGYQILWDVYFGPPGIPFPTLIPKSIHNTGLLKPDTHTFISFSMIKKNGLSRRGNFQSKVYCREDISEFDLVTCHKRCFLKMLDVGFNVFFFCCTTLYSDIQINPR